MQELQEQRQQKLSEGILTGTVGVFLELEANAKLRGPFKAGIDTIAMGVMDIETGEFRLKGGETNSPAMD